MRVRAKNIDDLTSFVNLVTTDHCLLPGYQSEQNWATISLSNEPNEEQQRHVRSTTRSGHISPTNETTNTLYNSTITDQTSNIASTLPNVYNY